MQDNVAVLWGSVVLCTSTQSTLRCSSSTQAPYGNLLTSPLRSFLFNDFSFCRGSQIGHLERVDVGSERYKCGDGEQGQWKR